MRGWSSERLRNAGAYRCQVVLAGTTMSLELFLQLGGWVRPEAGLGNRRTSQHWLSPQGALVRRIIYRLKGSGVTRVNRGKVEQRHKEQGDCIDSPVP